MQPQINRKWWVHTWVHVGLIKEGRLPDELLASRPHDAGMSDIDRIKIWPGSPGSLLVEVKATGVEL